MDFNSNTVISPVLVFIYVLVIILMYCLFFGFKINFETYAADSSLNNSNTSSTSYKSFNLGVEGWNRSFNAEGTINTILYAYKFANQDGAKKESEQDFNANLSETYVLGGKWRLDVINNNVTYFKLNITMITAKGTGEHFHVIVFKPLTVGISTLTSDIVGNRNFYTNPNNNTVSFSGSVDVITNGVIEWRDVHVIASIYNNNVLRVYLDKTETQNHFFGKSVLGLVNSIEPISNNISNAAK
jgi:hypothetical protein